MNKANTYFIIFLILSINIGVNNFDKWLHCINDNKYWNYGKPYEQRFYCFISQGRYLDYDFIKVAPVYVEAKR